VPLAHGSQAQRAGNRQKGEKGALKTAGTGQAAQHGVLGTGKQGGRGQRHSQSNNENGSERRAEVQSSGDGGGASEENSGAGGKGLRAREASFRGWLENMPSSGVSEAPASSHVLGGQELQEEFSLTGGLGLLGGLAEGRGGRRGGVAVMRPAASRLTDVDSVASSLEDACERGEGEPRADPREPRAGPGELRAEQVSQEPTPGALNQGHVSDALARLSQAAAAGAAVEAGSIPESELGLFTPEPQGPGTLRSLREALHVMSPGLFGPSARLGARCLGGRASQAAKTRNSSTASFKALHPPLRFFPEGRGLHGSTGYSGACVRDPTDPSLRPSDSRLSPWVGAGAHRSVFHWEQQAEGEKGPGLGSHQAKGMASWPDSLWSSATSATLHCVTE